MTGELNEFKDYDKEVIDIDEVAGTDIKINPDYYIHTAILKAQVALTKDDFKAGFAQYRVIVNHIETLCKSAKIIGEDYEKAIKDYLLTEEYKNEKDDLIKGVKLAEKKLGYLMEAVFSSKTSTDPILMKKQQ